MFLLCYISAYDAGLGASLSNTKIEIFCVITKKISTFAHKDLNDSTIMKALNKETAGKTARPEKVIQFGEGNFLRAFTDWIIQQISTAMWSS